MQGLSLKFDNEVSIKVFSGATGELREEWSGDNAISDDFICGGGAGGRIFNSDVTGPHPYCFLLPDGPNWAGFTWDRTNPYAPYSISVNNLLDGGAEPLWAPHPPQAASFAFLASDNITALPNPTGVAGRWRIQFAWGNPGIANDFQLRALGLTAWENDIADNLYGAGSSVNFHQTIFMPQTLVVLPSAITVHGRNGGAGTPDFLQVSYFLSVVGAS
jgi:hypothetical protein